MFVVQLKRRVEFLTQRRLSRLHPRVAQLEPSGLFIRYQAARDSVRCLPAKHRKFGLTFTGLAKEKTFKLGFSYR